MILLDIVRHCMPQIPKLSPFDWLKQKEIIEKKFDRTMFARSHHAQSLSLSFSIFVFVFLTLSKKIHSPFRHKGEANDLVLGTSIDFNLDQSNGSHIYLHYHNGDSMIRKCFAFAEHASRKSFSFAFC